MKIDIIKVLTGALTRPQKQVRRRSNWYVYLISFTATFVILGLFVLAMWDQLFPQNVLYSNRPGSKSNYIPDAELDVTILTMMSYAQGGTPEQFALINYRPRDEKIVIVPLNPETKVSDGRTTGTLGEIYRRSGATAVTSSIENTLGVSCAFYVKFERNSFMNFVGLLGEVTVNTPYSLQIGGRTLNAGQNVLDNSEFYDFIAYSGYEEADYRFAAAGASLVSMINNNARALTSEVIQNLFNKVLNNASTNLTFKDYTIYQQALSYNSENSVNPASYYVPSGSYDADGEFIISEESRQAILDKFALD